MKYNNPTSSTNTSSLNNPFLKTNEQSSTNSYQPSINSFFPNATNNTANINSNTSSNNFRSYLNPSYINSTNAAPSSNLNTNVNTNSLSNNPYNINTYKPLTSTNNPISNNYLTGTGINSSTNNTYQYNSSMVNTSTTGYQYVSKDLTAAQLKDSEYQTTKELVQGTTSFMQKEVKVSLNSITFHPDFSIFSNDELRYFNIAKRKIKKNYNVLQELPNYNNCVYIDKLSLIANTDHKLREHFNAEQLDALKKWENNVKIKPDLTLEFLGINIEHLPNPNRPIINSFETNKLNYPNTSLTNNYNYQGITNPISNINNYNTNTNNSTNSNPFLANNINTNVNSNPSNTGYNPWNNQTNNQNSNNIVNNTSTISNPFLKPGIGSQSNIGGNGITNNPYINNNNHTTMHPTSNNPFLANTSQGINQNTNSNPWSNTNTNTSNTNSFLNLRKPGDNNFINTLSTNSFTNTNINHNPFNNTNSGNVNQPFLNPVTTSTNPFMNSNIGGLSQNNTSNLYNYSNNANNLFNKNSYIMPNNFITPGNQSFHNNLSHNNAFLNNNLVNNHTPNYSNFVHPYQNQTPQLNPNYINNLNPYTGLPFNYDYNAYYQNHSQIGNNYKNNELFNQIVERNINDERNTLLSYEDNLKLKMEEIARNERLKQDELKRYNHEMERKAFKETLKEQYEENMRKLGSMNFEADLPYYEKDEIGEKNDNNLLDLISVNNEFKHRDYYNEYKNDKLLESNNRNNFQSEYNNQNLSSQNLPENRVNFESNFYNSKLDKKSIKSDYNSPNNYNRRDSKQDSRQESKQYSRRDNRQEHRDNFQDFYQSIKRDEDKRNKSSITILKTLSKETIERNLELRKNVFFKIVFNYPEYFTIRLNLNLQKFQPNLTDKFFIPDIKMLIFSKLEVHEVLKGQYIHFTLDSITLSNNISVFEDKECLLLDDILNHPDLVVNDDETKDFILEAKFNSSFLKDLKLNKRAEYEIIFGSNNDSIHSSKDRNDGQTNLDFNTNLDDKLNNQENKENQEKNIEKEIKEVKEFSLTSPNNHTNYNNNIKNSTKHKKYLPKLTKKYKLNPSYEDIINNSTEESLKSLLGFSISNEFGSIQFLSPVNLCNVNLDDFEIDNKLVQLNSTNVNHPLNKPARITIKNLLDSDKLSNMDDNDYQLNLNKIRKICDNLKVKLLLLLIIYLLY